MRARLRNDYRPVYPNPIRLQPGQIVTLGLADAEWPAFVWVTVHNEQCGWAPLAWLRPLADGRAEVLRDYDARELLAECGELVTLHHEHGGWWWSERADGTQGWLPATDLELLEENVL